MTKEEAIIIIDSLNPGVIIKTSASDEKIKEAIKMALIALSQPSLPSNLDEAVEKYSENILANNEDLQDAIEDAFKAGAEWMARQGVTEEYDVDEDGIYLDSDSLGVCLMAWPPSKLHCKEGDTLIIQMRKRKSGKSLKEKEKEI